MWPRMCTCGGSIQTSREEWKHESCGHEAPKVGKGGRPRIYLDRKSQMRELMRKRRAEGHK